MFFFAKDGESCIATMETASFSVGGAVPTEGRQRDSRRKDTVDSGK